MHAQLCTERAPSMWLGAFLFKVLFWGHTGAAVFDQCATGIWSAAVEKSPSSEGLFLAQFFVAVSCLWYSSNTPTLLLCPRAFFSLTQFWCPPASQSPSFSQPSLIPGFLLRFCLGGSSLLLPTQPGHPLGPKHPLLETGRFLQLLAMPCCCFSAPAQAGML